MNAEPALNKEQKLIPEAIGDSYPGVRPWQRGRAEHPATMYPRGRLSGGGGLASSAHGKPQGEVVINFVKRAGEKIADTPGPKWQAAG